MQPDLVTEIEFKNLTKPFRKGAPSALRARAIRAAVVAYKLEIATANVSLLSNDCTFLDDETAASNLGRLIKREPIEDWAGPIMLLTDAAIDLGISRTTLHNWRKAGDVIVLPKGKNRTAFPMLQFVDCQPLKGIKALLGIVDGDARTAWRWLVTPHADFDQSPPIRALISGDVESVLSAARWSLGG